MSQKVMSTINIKWLFFRKDFYMFKGSEKGVHTSDLIRRANIHRCMILPGLARAPGHFRVFW